MDILTTSILNVSKEVKEVIDMTRNEALTRVLEEGRKVFENGGAFSVNGVLFANYLQSADLKFEYEENTETIKVIFMCFAGLAFNCVYADSIDRVSVSNEWLWGCNSDGSAYGRLDGKRFRIEKEV